MRTALYEPTTPGVAVGLPDVADWPAQTATARRAPARWRSQVFEAPSVERAGKRRATRYERFTTRMVLVSSVIMLGVTACLHVFNYGLETKTSSTSGTHGSFYKEND